MAMRTRKTYLIIEKHTGRIMHTSSDRNESMKLFEQLMKANKKVSANAIEWREVYQ